MKSPEKMSDSEPDLEEHQDGPELKIDQKEEDQLMNGEVHLDLINFEKFIMYSLSSHLLSPPILRTQSRSPNLQFWNRRSRPHRLKNLFAQNQLKNQPKNRKNQVASKRN